MTSKISHKIALFDIKTKEQKIFHCKFRQFPEIVLFICYNINAGKYYEKGGVIMEKWIDKRSGILAAFALIITTIVANSTCNYIMHQESLPKSAKKLRKF